MEIRLGDGKHSNFELSLAADKIAKQARLIRLNDDARFEVRTVADSAASRR